MKFARVVAMTALVVCGAGPSWAQNVQVSFRDGKVTLIAQNASLRAVLTEWARQGGTQVVNMERLAGPPVTLQLTDIPEMQALDIILRGNAGYIAGLRAATTEPVGTRSSLDRILVVPTVGTAAAVSNRPTPQPPPFSPPQRIPQPDPDDDPVSDEPPDDDPPPNRGNRMNVPANVPRGGPNQPPQPFEPQDDDPPEEEEPTTPANPFGVQPGSARPGTITPVPPQPERPRTQPDPEP